MSQNKIKHLTNAAIISATLEADSKMLKQKRKQDAEPALYIDRI
ncbi:MAG: hypothetical protein NWE98_09870 [Candidatus Bathyarchaeota archaeon]|nr:hypothetical protein [Candidatus Bathyarchaeota archaeon]